MAQIRPDVDANRELRMRKIHTNKSVVSKDRHETSELRIHYDYYYNDYYY